MPERVRQWAASGHRDIVDATFDVVVCCFVLSALPPHLHAAALSSMRRVLKPGGWLLVRDYGVYDAAMLRAEADALVTPRLHRRGDGTLAYYLDKEELRDVLTATGFTVKGDVEYCRVLTRNRKRGLEMRRVWVNATAQRPVASEAGSSGADVAR